MEGGKKTFLQVSKETGLYSTTPSSAGEDRVVVQKEPQGAVPETTSTIPSQGHWLLF